MAPAAFAVLPTRTLAGELVGRVLPVIFWSGMLLGIAAAIVCRMTGTALLPLAGCVVTVLSCAVAQLLISPRIERVRAAIGGPVDALDAADPRRIDFGRLHGLSVLSMGVAGVGAIVALAAIAHFLSARSSA